MGLGGVDKLWLCPASRRLSSSNSRQTQTCSSRGKFQIETNCCLYLTVSEKSSLVGFVTKKCISADSSSVWKVPPEVPTVSNSANIGEFQQDAMLHSCPDLDGVTIGCLSALTRKGHQLPNDFGPLPSRPSPSTAHRARPSCRPSKRRIPHLCRGGTGGSWIAAAVIQDFEPEADDELKVVRGDHVRLFFIEGEWAYVSTTANRQVAERGFIPAYYCRRLTAGEGDGHQRLRGSPKSEQQQLGQNVPSAPADFSVRSTPIPAQFANPYHQFVQPSSAGDRSKPETGTMSPRVNRRPPLTTSYKEVGLASPSWMFSEEFPFESRVLYDFNVDGRASETHIDCCRGDSITVLGRKGDWFIVRKRNGREGSLPACFAQASFDKGSLPTPPPEQAPSPPLPSGTAARRLDFDLPLIAQSPDIINAIPVRKKARSHPFATTYITSMASGSETPSGCSPRELMQRWLAADDDGSLGVEMLAPRENANRQPWDEGTKGSMLKSLSFESYQQITGHVCVGADSSAITSVGQSVDEPVLANDGSPDELTFIDNSDADFRSIVLSDWYHENQHTTNTCGHPVVAFFPEAPATTSGSLHERSDSVDSAVSVSSNDSDERQPSSVELHVIAKFVPSSSNEVAVLAGDVVRANPLRAYRGWLWVEVARTKQQGYIPLSYTQPDVTTDVTT